MFDKKNEQQPEDQVTEQPVVAPEPVVETVVEPGAGSSIAEIKKRYPDRSAAFYARRLAEA